MKITKIESQLFLDNFGDEHAGVVRLRSPQVASPTGDNSISARMLLALTKSLSFSNIDR